MKKKNQNDIENKKILTKVLIGVILYGILMSILIVKFGIDEEETELNSYLIIDDVYLYQYEDNKMKKISFLDTNYDKHLFDIYRDGEYSGAFYVSNISHDYVNFIKKGSSGMYRPTIPYIALTQDIEYIEYEKEELNLEDIQYIENMMFDKGIYDIGTIDNSSKVKIDLDNDQVEETIYQVTNYNYDFVPENVFSLIYIMDDNNIEIIEEYYEISENVVELPQCDLKHILDLSGEGNYTLVVSNSDYDETYLNFYNNNGSNYIDITSN